MVLIIGVSGKKGVGKDHVVRNVLVPMFVRRGYRVTTMAFADALKVFLATGGKCTMDELYADSKTVRVRELLQRVGTDVIRNSHGEDWWTRQLDAWIDVRLRRDPVDVVFVPDVRFHNECAWIEQKGGLLLRVVEKDPGGDDGGDGHAAEETNGDGGYVGYLTSLVKSMWYGKDKTEQHRSETELTDDHCEHHVYNPRNRLSSHQLMTQLVDFEAIAVQKLKQ